jgi:hypothetical protein
MPVTHETNSEAQHQPLSLHECMFVWYVLVSFMLCNVVPTWKKGIVWHSVRVHGTMRSHVSSNVIQCAGNGRGEKQLRNPFMNGLPYLSASVW